MASLSVCLAKGPRVGLQVSRNSWTIPETRFSVGDHKTRLQTPRLQATRSLSRLLSKKLCRCLKAAHAASAGEYLLSGAFWRSHSCESRSIPEVIDDAVHPPD